MDKDPHHRPAVESSSSGCSCLALLVIAAAAAAFFFREEITGAIGESGVSFDPSWLIVLIPIFIVAAIVITRIARSRRAAAESSAPAKPISGTRRSTGSGRTVGRIVFGVFFLFGLAFMIPFALMLRDILDSRGWDAHRCTVESSRVETDSGSDGPTYSIDIDYTWEVGGERFSGDRYNFTFGSSSGYDGKAEVVRRYPPGAEVDCWVDPDDPSRAVLDRGIGWEASLILLPLLFTLIGLGGLLASFGAFGLGSGKREDWLPGTDAEESAMGSKETRTIPRHEMADDSLVMKSETSPVGRLIGSIIFALFWNGFVVGAVWLVLSSGETENFGCFMTVFAIFGLVGLLLLISIPYNVLALRNPRPTLRLGDHVVPGKRIDLSWSFEGNARKIRKLTIRIKGMEIAKYRQGTSTSTAAETFHEETLAEIEEAHTIPSGHTTFELPGDTMHSFDGGNNKITWTISVEGDIPRWPDVNETFELTVRPASLG